jgi:hypothetical protein
MDKASSLDEIIAAHNLYLKDICERTLLTVPFETLNMQVCAA